MKLIITFLFFTLLSYSLYIKSKWLYRLLKKRISYKSPIKLSNLLQQIEDKYSNQVVAVFVKTEDGIWQAVGDVNYLGGICDCCQYDLEQNIVDWKVVGL